MVRIVEIQLKLLDDANYLWHFVRIEPDHGDVPVQENIIYESKKGVAAVKFGENDANGVKGKSVINNCSTGVRLRY